MQDFWIPGLKTPMLEALLCRIVVSVIGGPRAPAQTAERDHRHKNGPPKNCHFTQPYRETDCFHVEMTSIRRFPFSGLEILAEWDDRDGSGDCNMPAKLSVPYA